MSADRWNKCPKCLLTNAGVEETFREDFYIGLSQNGFFQIEYHGRCLACGFSHRIQEGKQLVKQPSRGAGAGTYP